MSSVFRKSFLDAKRHFWRMHYIISEEKIPDSGFGFSDENEDKPLAIDAPQVKREERIVEKLSKMQEASTQEGGEGDEEDPLLNVHDIISV